MRFARTASSLALLSLSAACHSATPRPALTPGWESEKGIDRERVLLSSWRPTAPQFCVVAINPTTLPAVDALLTTENVPLFLQQGGIADVRGSALLSLKFDSTGTPTRVRVIEGTIPESAVPVVELAIASALRPQEPGSSWGVRLRVELDSVPSFRVGRSEKCLPAPRPTLNDTHLTTTARGYSATTVQVDRQARTVRLGVTVDERGHVVDAKILDSEGDPMAQTVRGFVLEQRYFPGLDDGIPAEMTVERRERISMVRAAKVLP
jgi:hypothetical protein